MSSYLQVVYTLWWQFRSPSPTDNTQNAPAAGERVKQLHIYCQTI